MILPNEVKPAKKLEEKDQWKKDNMGDPASYTATAYDAHNESATDATTTTTDAVTKG